MDTAVTLKFADGEYLFHLPLPQIVELERKTGDTSIFTIEARLRDGMGQDASGEFVFAGGGAPMIADIRETLRLGLIGGNSGVVDGEEAEVGPGLAKSLIDTYVYPARPMAEGAVLAWRVLHAAINGVQVQGSKKKPDAKSPIPSEKDS